MHSLVARLHSQRDAASKHADPSKPGSPEYPSFSFAGLGATRAVKVTVLVALGVAGTLETIFWTKALLRYCFPSPSPDKE